MRLNQKLLYNLLLIIVASVVTVYTLSYMVTKPSTALVTMGGDGIKNYFTYLYQAANGSGLQFDGMNYPYGEHLVYTDAQPLLSVPLSYINKVVPLSYNTLLAILHIALAISFFLAIVFTYKILTHFKVHPLFAIATSTLIVLMSPQIFRVYGHFGLGYQSMIPMLFYWNIKYYHTRKVSYAILLLLFGIACALLHPYCAALFFIWLLLYAFGYLLIEKRDWKNKIYHASPIVLAALGIVAFVKILMLVTDTKVGRTEYPYGTLSDCTVAEDIFTSNSSPIWQGLEQLGLFTNVTRGEGLAYLGVVGIVAVLIAIITIILKTIKKKKAFAVSQEYGFSPIWLFVALGTFLLAQGVPFVWRMEWLLDYVSTFRQFRTLGRFAMLFYYIASVYSVILLYALFIKFEALNKKKLAYTIICIPTLLWTVEANGYVISSRKAISEAMYNYMFVFEYYDWKKLMSYQWVDADEFQGIVLLPYVHLGSEKIWLNDENIWVYTFGVSNSLQLKRPLVNVHMSRTPWQETFAQVKTIAGPLVKKPTLDLLPNDKPLLLIHLHADELDPDSRYLLDMADHINRFEQIDAYVLAPDKLKKYEKKYRDSIRFVAKNITAADTCIGCRDYSYIIDHLDEDEGSSIFGAGARQQVAQESTEIKTYALKPLADTVLYEFSFWSLVNDFDYSTPTFYVETLDSSGNSTSLNMVKAALSVDNEQGGSWLRANKYFNVPKHTYKLKVTIPEVYLDKFLALDEIVFRPANSTTYSINNSAANKCIMVNNHVLTTK